MIQIASGLVSVVLPVRNDEEYLTRCINSILKQSYTKFEIIAIDDFSTDRSYAILENYAKKDKRIVISRNVKRYGLAISLNRAVRKAKGQFICFMKAQDSNNIDRFSKQIDFLFSHKKTVGVGSQSYFVNKSGKHIGKSNFPIEELAIYQKPIHGVTMLFEGLIINRFLIPKDLLYFQTDRHPFIYSDIIVKLLQYGKLANLPTHLYTHTKFDLEKPNKLREAFTTARLWVRSEALYGYRPSLRSFVLPLLRIKMSA